MNYKIRELRRGDITEAFFATLKNLDLVDSDHHRAREILVKIKNKDYRIFAAMDENGRVVGLVTLLIEQKFIRGFGKLGHLEDVVVKRGHGSQGIGTALVKKATQEAKRSGCYAVRLCASIEMFHKFYKKSGLGYKIDGISATKYF